MKNTLAALSVAVLTFQANANTLETGTILGVESSPETLSHENGCPNGSYDWAVSPDNQFLSLRFYNFDVLTGIPDASGTRLAEKRCQLISRLRIPAGYMVGIESASVRANVYASDHSSTGYMGISYGPANDWPVTILNQSYAGPIDREVTVNGRLPFDRIIFTRCSSMDTEQSFVLNSVLSTRADSFGDSTIESQRDYGAIMQEFRFVWLRCGSDPGPGPGPGNWHGSCRVVLETIWGQDIREFFGAATAHTENDAIRAARQAGLNACERARSGDDVHRCITDTNNCFATR